MSSPVVSVVLPTYKRLTYLPQALESVLAQTYGDFEVVVTDNSASPEVEALVTGYGDSRVRYRHNGGNIGLQPNLLAGYRAGRGRLLATIHDDDAWEPEFLARLVPPLLADPSLTIAFCDYSVMDVNGEIDAVATETHTRLERRDRLAAGAHDRAARLAVVDQSIQVSYAAVFRSDVDLDAVPADLAPLYDLWIAYLATVDGGRAWYCPERLTRYRHHGGSATSANPFHPQEIESFRRFLADPRLAHVAPQLRRKKARAEFRQGVHLLFEGGDPEVARKMLRGSARTFPNPLAVGSLVASVVPGGRTLLGRLRAQQHQKTLTLTGS